MYSTYTSKTLLCSAAFSWGCEVGATPVAAVLPTHLVPAAPGVVFLNCPECTEMSAGYLAPSCSSSAGATTQRFLREPEHRDSPPWPEAPLGSIAEIRWWALDTDPLDPGMYNQPPQPTCKTARFKAGEIVR